VFEFPGKTALITGASAGIGKEFAKQLSARRANLILVARRRQRLEELAKELMELNNCQVYVLEADLSKPTIAKEIRAFVKSNNLKVDILVNNAGFGTYGSFIDQSPERELEEIAVNVSSLVALCHEFVPDMTRRGHGAVLNVSSVAGFQPLAYMAVYAATKAFVLSFSEALWAELTPYKVRVLAVCPGPVDTEFFQVAGSSPTGKPETVSHCVQMALAALDKGRSHVVTGGLRNNVLSKVHRFTSREFILRAAAIVLKPRR
jgi:short-subunit dehydrogenase